MKKVLAIFLGILTICQSCLGAIYGLALGGEAYSPEERFLYQIHTESTEHNHDVNNVEESNFDHEQTLDGDHDKRAEELLVYASAVCTTHTYSAYTVTRAATCTSSGSKSRYCTWCGATNTASISALGHQFGGTVYTVVATCTSGGYSYNTCSRCSAHNNFNSSSALGHNYTEVTKQATCVVAGTKKCSRCTSTTSIPATGVHSYTVTTLAATCTSTGTKKCANCTSTQSITALGHKFEGSTYIVQPTCTSGGYSYVGCSRCTAENKFSITSAAGHNYTEITKVATCIATGTKKCSRCTSTTSIPATGVHSYTVTSVAATCAGSGTKKCAYCTDTQTISALGHKFEGSTYIVQPSCTTGGYSYVGCSRCTAENRFNTTPAAGHNYSEITKSATCVATGTKKCSRCTSTTSIPATGVHNYAVTTVSATCTSTGTKQCDNCTATQSVSALGHMFGGTTYTVTPNCTTGGYSYVNCSQCSAENRFNTTSAVGHNYSVIINAATCVATGTNKCSRCSSTTSVPATGIHSYTVTTVSATCTSMGTKKCESCTATQSSSALGHMFGGETYTIIPSCTEGGYSYVNCSRCTAENKFSPTSAAGHSYSVITNTATCEATGTNKCFRCSSTTTIPALGHMFGGEPYVVVPKCEEGGYSYVLCTRCETEKSIFDVTSKTGHNYSLVIKEPTCIAEGTNNCSRCISTTSTPATGEHIYTIPVVVATCTSAGTNKCENCTSLNSIPVLGHKFEGSTYTVLANCDEGGYSYNLCSRCNTEKNKFDITPKLGHDHSQVIKEPICDTEGINKCSRCISTTSTPATGEHIYTVIIEASTCTSTGTKKCENCTSLNSIPVLGHKFEGSTYTVLASCDEGGYSYNLCSRCNTEKNQFNITPKLGHKYSETYSINDTNHWKECTKCEETTENELHTFNSEQICTICDYDPLIEVTNIILSNLPLVLYTGEVYTVSAVITPDNATDKTLTWSSSDTSVATVSSNGLVTPVRNGSVTITATSKDGLARSIEASVHSISELSMQIGDWVIFENVSPQPWSINIVQGMGNILRINPDNSIIALDAGEAVIMVDEEMTTQYYRIIVTKQEKLTSQQVINLTGPAPIRLYEHTSNERTFTFEDIMFDVQVGSSLLGYYCYEVLPKVNGMSFETDHALNTAGDDLTPGFNEWLWMMYGYMAPTQEELVHMNLHLIGMIPIIGTVAEGYNTYLYYIEGDVMSALLNSGVVVVSVIGDYYLIKNIVRAVKITFKPDARIRLAAMTDTEISTASRSMITEYLDDFEISGGLAGGTGNLKYKFITSESADNVNLSLRNLGYTELPYLPGSTVQTIELIEQTKFVRVYDGVNSQQVGGWLMKAEDIAGLTPQQIQAKFALPTTPEYVTDVILEAGTRLRKGTANGLFGFDGGGNQLDLMGQYVGEFVNARLLN